MDIKNLLPTRQSFELKFPSGEGTGITLHVQGQDSKEFRDAAKKFAAAQLARKKDDAIDLDALEKQRIDLAVVCLVGWDGVEEDDVPVEFSKAKAKELLSKPELSFIVEQVEEFVALRANFFRGRSNPAA